jgi:Tannase and feruloyl esterase
LLPSQLDALSRTALESCDASDGVTDGIIADPLSCSFDPAKLLCRGASNGRCLSAIQLQALHRLYEGARDSRTHASVTPGMQGSLGTESTQWPGFATPGPLDAYGDNAKFFSDQFFRYMVYEDPKLDVLTLDPLKASMDARSKVGMLLNALDPDLSNVRATGKRIIQYHGTADALIPYAYSVDYYRSVEQYLGSDSRDFYRLFLLPGMEHCGGGPGPNVIGGSYNPGAAFDAKHNVLAALMQWVEKGEAPDRIVATKYQDDDPHKPILRTRPACVYPNVARWTHKGSTDDERNFVCAHP